MGTLTKEKLMRNSIKNTVGVVILVAAASISGTWCGVNCPEDESYVPIESCPPGQVVIGFEMKKVKEFKCLDVDTCTGSHIVVCVLCLTTTYEIAEPVCGNRTDFPEMPWPFPGDYGG